MLLSTDYDAEFIMIWKMFLLQKCLHLKPDIILVLLELYKDDALLFPYTCI